MKKNAQQAQNMQKLQQDIKKEVVVQKPLSNREAEIKIHQKKLIVDKRSLFIFHIKSKIRYAMLMFTEWKWFDRTVIFVIFLNSMFLAIYDYSDREDTSIRNRIVDVAGRIFTVFFTIECICKIISYGFIVHRNAYLRDSWNWLDFIVVIIGWMELLPDIPNLRGLRTLRVLRPLRSINAIPSMKSQITSLLKSLGQLVNVLLFLMFLFIIFGILGVQLYQGQFYQRCRLTPAPDEFGNWPIDPTITRLCAYNTSDGWFQCPTGTYCGAPLDFNLSLDNENLTQWEYNNFGITTFDNLGMGMLTIFQTITLEGWSDLMYMLMDSGAPWLAGVYFIFLVFIGAFFLMNIILVIIISNYSDTKDQQKKEAQQKKEQDDLASKKVTPMIKQDGKTQAVKKQLEIQTFQLHEESLVIKDADVKTPRKDVIDQQPQSLFLPRISSSPKIKNQKDIFDVDDFLEEHQTKRELIPELTIEKESKDGKQYEQEKTIANVQMEHKVSEGNRPIHTKGLPSISEMFKSNEDSQPQRLPILKKFQGMLLKIAMSGYFAALIMIFIVINTLTLALDTYPGDPERQTVFDRINMVLTWCFFGEMIIKLGAFGPKLYARDRVNLFDAVIVILTITENIATLVMDDVSSVSTGGALSGLRAIRLFRIFKLARNLKSFQVMLNKITMSLKDIANFSVLLFLFLFTFTLMGMELFSNKVKYDADGNMDLINGQSPRTNFDYFLSAFTTIFIVLIGDGWNQIMYQYWIALGSYTALFFIILQVFGKYILLNLFLAILLENFEDIEDKEASEVDKSTNSEKLSLMASFKLKLKSLMLKKQAVTVQPVIFSRSNTLGAYESPRFRGVDGNESVRSRLDKQSQSFLKDNESQYGGDLKSFKFNPESMSPMGGGRSRPQGELTINRMNSLQNVANTNTRMSRTQNRFFPANQNNISGIDNNQHMVSIFQTENELCDGEGNSTNRNLIQRTGEKSQFQSQTKKKKNMMEDLITPKNKVSITLLSNLKGKSFYLLGPTNKCRLFLSKIISHRFFDPFILALILFSTLTMTVDNPLNDPNGELSNVLNYIDIVVTTIFTLEMTLKILVNGLIVNGDSSYLRNSWNIMDFFIVLFSIISILFSDLNIQFIKVIRMLRVLRPLRMISRNEGLKLAVVSLINAIPSIINALVIALLFFILFGIFGTNYFKGKFYYCLMDNIHESVDQSMILSKWDCINTGGDWINQIMNFDNILNSMMSLYILSSTEGWADIMFHGVDATAIDYNPQNNNAEGWVFFFMAFMVVGSMFTLNLFVSIVVNTYYGEKEKLSQNHVLSKYQKQWIQSHMLCLETQPNKPKISNQNPVSKFLQKFSAENSPFDMFILACIIINTLLMTLDWYDAPQSMQQGLDYVNYVFTAIFTIEAIIKIIAYGKTYFIQGWNIFDFIIVVISYVTLILGQASSAQVGPKQATIARAFRIGRIFRLIKKAKFLRIIFNTIILTIPSLANVGALLILLLYIFSILGVQAFATIKLQDNLNDHGNFQSFGVAFLTLIRLQTGENWNAMLEDTLRIKSVNFDCDMNPTYESIQANGGNPNGCGGPIAYLFFIMFTLIVSIIFMNLFVAVILQGFTSSNEEESLEMQRKLSEDFKKVWETYDPQATGYISIHDLEKLIDDLEENSKLICQVIKRDYKLRRTFISGLQIPTYHKFSKYNFQDVLSCLSKKYIQHQYVIEKLQEIEFEDPSQVSEEKVVLEGEFDEEMDDIDNKGNTIKIQMVEKSLKLKQKYSKKMVGNVDQFEGRVYDSSYVVWVPVIQTKIKPLLLRLLDRKRQHNRINVLMDQNNLTLIMETGGQLNEQKNISEVSPRSHNRGASINQQQRDSVTITFGQQRRPLMMGQTTTTGEVGGTIFNEGESMDHEYDRVIDEEMKVDEIEYRRQRQ